MLTCNAVIPLFYDYDIHFFFDHASWAGALSRLRPRCIDGLPMSSPIVCCSSSYVEIAYLALNPDNLLDSSRTS